MQRGGEDGRAAGAERLAEHGVHAGGEARQHRVASDVGETEREGEPPAIVAHGVK